jgi:lipoprotein NlpI
MYRLALFLFALISPLLAADYELLVAEADAALRKGELAHAIKTATSAIEADGEQLQAYIVRGFAHEQRRAFADALADFDRALEIRPDLVGLRNRRGDFHFRLGNFAKSLADYDAFLAAHPEQKPYHWKRGITCYYAGAFKEGREQFEVHRTVNPNDVENSAWHFLCLTRETDVAAAREQLIPTGGDGRVPMMKVHALFADSATPADVLAVATDLQLSPRQRQQAVFYAHLYLGLYYEAIDEQERANRHIMLAAEDYAVDHYMGDVARVHAERIRQAQK